MLDISGLTCYTLPNLVLLCKLCITLWLQRIPYRTVERYEQTLLVQMLLVRLFTIDFLLLTAERVLKEYRVRFVAEMDASTIVSDLCIMA